MESYIDTNNVFHEVLQHNGYQKSVLQKTKLKQAKKSEDEITSRDVGSRYV